MSRLPHRSPAEITERLELDEGQGRIFIGAYIQQGFYGNTSKGFFVRLLTQRRT